MKKIVMGFIVGLAVVGWNAGVRVIHTKAPDGVNTITAEVDADGFVRAQSSTCVHVLRKYEPEAK